MANGANVGTAYISVIPEMKGIQGKIAKQLGAEVIGDDAGKKLGAAMASSAGKSSSALMASFNSVGDRIAFKTRTSLGAAFDNVAKGARDKMGALASNIGARFDAIGKAFSSTGIGHALTTAFSAGAGALVTLGAKAKGAAQFVGDAFKGIGEKLGAQFGPFVAKAQTAFSKVGTAASNAFKTVGKVAAVGLAAAAAAVGGFLKSSIDGFAEYEQLAGGAQKIFDEIDYSGIEADAKAAYVNMGMSANEYLGVINQVGAGFAATMGDKKGYETAKKGMQAISDYASGTGRSVSELNEKYSLITRSASSYQSVADQFSGILPATSAAFLEQAQKAGLLSGEYTSLTEVPLAEYQQAVTGMLEKGVDALGLTGNTAAEATETISGSIGMLKGAWSNFVTELGKDNADIDGSFSALVDSAIAVFSNVVPRAVEIVGKLFSAVPAAIAQHGPRLLAAMAQVLDDATGGAFSRVAGTLGPHVERLGQAFGHIAEALAPVAEALGSFAETVIPILGDAFASAAELMQPVADFLGDVLPPIIDGVGKAIETLADWVHSAFDAIGKAADGAASFIKDPLGSIGKLFMGTGRQSQTTEKTVTKSFSDMGRSVASSAKGIQSSAKTTDADVKNSFSDMSRSASGSMSGLAGNVSSSSEKARQDAINKFGAMQTGISSKTLAAKTSAASNFEALSKSVTSSATNTATTAVNKANAIAKAWNKKYNMQITATATGNAVSGVAEKALKSTKTAISNLFSKTVTASANGNATDYTASNAIWATVDAIKALIANAVVAASVAIGSWFGNAAGGIRYHADGMIVNKPTWIGGRDIAGESGAEAIIPLTNRRYVAPFAETVADFINEPQGGGVTVSGNTFIVRKESDIPAIGRAINLDAERQRKAKLGKGAQ